MGMNEYLNNSGYLDTGDGHQIYWEDWGNKQARPILYLHGGPGGGFSDKNKALFDPAEHRVIFHDQRGSGRSKPFGETRKNTMQDLIADIEALRAHLGIVGKAYVAGGSWGSTLALLYALAHPEKVEKLLVWSIFLARQFEVDYVNEGYPRYSFPEAWERFIGLVPPSHRANGTAIMKYYAGKINSRDQEIAKKYADEWTLWEYSLLSINYDQAVCERDILGDEKNLAVAKLETHYFLEGCFIPENYILETIGKLRDIPCSIVHGRFDMCTPPVSARDLAKAYGAAASLLWVNSGHRRTDPEMFEAIRRTAGRELA